MTADMEKAENQYDLAREAMQQLLILLTGHPNEKHVQSASGALA